ncbi:MAG: hypothetical protein ABJF04_05655 [Reichenbachiella sp.]|uniref:hypothetical protein n=1 Tax=Reichenbachiella sp. TaxID=2184521 RepID=UPI0032632B33
MRRILAIAALATLASCSYRMYDKTTYAELEFTEDPTLTVDSKISEVYLMSTYRSSKVLYQVIDSDTIYDDISIPIYSSVPSKDTVQSAYLIFNPQTEKVCYKVYTNGDDASGPNMYFQAENSGCDLFGKYQVKDRNTIGLNLMNDKSLAFHISCRYTSEGNRIGQIKFEVIDYKNGLSETQGSKIPPIKVNQVFHTQLIFKETDLTYKYLTNNQDEVERTSVEVEATDEISVRTKRGRSKRVSVKGYPFFLK